MTIQLNRATSFDMACGEWECQAAMSSTPPLTSFKCFYLGRCHDKGLIDSLQLLARPAPYTSRRQDSRGGSANSFMTELAHDTWTRCHGAACRRQQSRSTTAMSSSCCRHNWIVSMGFGGWNSVFLRIRS
ncbi:hypothetical protein FOCG_10750 [Fusarium oxysporum f. sp. radicis-lycopersici 26381]|uniref:Uncharacterized protein n=1 Tax=Fusarium oxysporum Fo47 TaxID=660027 RepID=W9JRC4_FUSOX|nr:hypothetical protein FOZG_12521 [Fusarium oxysporum Fo47]EWZ95314.1 hypothetical protein FOWG_05262 [Fusarium oxysporum f. sp. lycopersici MN25]EXL48303.1 hypothetical protein FOCG_10750 [Fusarium oxysporum f. sp. radicis-lycopersici 26381]